jgi:hypothetical protein
MLIGVRGETISNCNPMALGGLRSYTMLVIGGLFA